MITVIKKIERKNYSNISFLLSSLQSNFLPPKYSPSKIKSLYSRIISYQPKKSEYPYSFISVDFHEAAQKQTARLLKKVKSIKTLQRKSARDFKLKSQCSHASFFWSNEWIHAQKIRERALKTITQKPINSYRELEFAVEKIRKSALNSARNVLRVRVLRGPLMKRSGLQTAIKLREKLQKAKEAPATNQSKPLPTANPQKNI